MKKNNYKKYILLLFLFLGFGYYLIIAAQETMSGRLRGRILLQVEKNGEAWYVYPASEERYFLGRPADAFNIMRTLGVGISNKDIEKIPVAADFSNSKDSDNDGLSDNYENAIGTNITKDDTDNDGFSDKEEILSGHNPLGEGTLAIDSDFAVKQAGKILIQAEKNGEAWYVCPQDNKRYFLGRPADAFAIMRRLSLGITNDDLAKIPAATITEQSSQKIANYTRPANSGSNLRKYIDPQNRFVLEYPQDWKIKRPTEKNNVLFFGDYQKDPFLEKRALIVVSYIKTTKNLSLNNFSIASKDGAKKKEDKNLEFNGAKALQQEFSYSKIGITEITTTLKLSDNEYMQLILTAAGSAAYYEKIYNNMLQSINKQ